MNSFKGVQSTQPLQLSLSQTVVARLPFLIKDCTHEAARHPEILELIGSLDYFIKQIPQIYPGQIPIFSSQDDDQPLPNARIPQYWLSRIQRFPDHEHQYTVWDIDLNGASTGFVALRFQRPNKLDDVLKEEIVYSPIQQESELVIIVRTSLTSIDEYPSAFNRICEYFKWKYGLIPVGDCSKITTRFRMGHDPLMFQRLGHPEVIWQNLPLPQPTVKKNCDSTDNPLITSILNLLGQGMSQRKIATQLGIPQS